MKTWIRDNPEKWQTAMQRWNVGQPLPGKDPAHIEWRGPKPAGKPTGVAEPLDTRGAPLRGLTRDTSVDRSALAATDKTFTARVDGRGQINVDVKAPPGTKATANGEGLFKKTVMTRQTQNEPADSGPREPVSAGAGEE
jgi:hypothetical protein